MNLTKFIHTKKIKQFNSISKTLLTIATCYCNLGKYIKRNRQISQRLEADLKTCENIQVNKL